MNEIKPEVARDATRMRVANNLSAELRRQRLSQRQTATALGLTLSYVTRRVSGVTELTSSDLEMFASFLNIPVSRFFLNDNDAPAANGRAGASVMSGIVLMDGVRKVGPAGIEPTTSTVEAGKFAADWVAPVRQLRAAVSA